MIQEDDESLETLESGSWEDISRSHCDLVAPVVTPSGHPNRYGVIPWRFPGSVELTGISALSDTLVGHQRWSSPAVLAERDIILGSNQAMFDSYIAAWRAKAITLFQEVWSQVQKVEATAFGLKSYFSESGDILEDDDDPNPELEEIMMHKSVWFDATVGDVIAEDIGSASGSRKRKRIQEENESELSSPPDSGSSSDKGEG